MKNRVDIKCEGDSEHLYVRPYVNGEYLPRCNSMIPDDESNITKVTFIPGEFPWLYIENVETDLSGFLKIAAIIFRNELLKHDDLYKGFLASIKSALDEHGHMCCHLEDENINLANEILKRIIGEE